MSETIYQSVRRLVIDEAHTPEDAAAAALTGMTKAQLIEFVLPEVERLARSIERGRVRRLEQSAFTGRNGTKTRPEAIASLVGESFMLPDGRFVTWGAATADDHDARAQWHRASAHELLAGARRHEAAAELIRSAGALCLDEVSDWPTQLELSVAA